MVGDMVRPNGICFSPDESLLYMSDTGSTGGAGRSAAYPRVRDGGCAHAREWARLRGHEAGGADGIRTDTDGNLWAAAGWAGDGFDGAHCYAPDGDVDRQDSSAGAVLESVFRRREEEPALHDGGAVAVRRLCRGDRRAAAVGGAAEAQ